MAPGRGSRIALAAGIAALALATAAWLALMHLLERQVLRALGPRASVRAIHLVYPSLVLEDVRLPADPTPRAWPAAEEARAARVRMRVGLGALWAAHRGEPLRIDALELEDGELTVLRTRGHLEALPSLRESAPGAPADAPRPAGVVIEHLRLERMALVVVDASLGRARPVRLDFTDVRADIAGLSLPGLDTSIGVDVQANLQGSDGRTGPLTVKGQLGPARHDADLAIRLRDGDLVTLQPYLLRFGEGGVRQGRLDLALDARIQAGQVRAPGHLTLRGLAFNDAGGTFAGLPRKVVIAALTRDGRLEATFTLTGRIDDPRFALDESLGGRIAVGLAETVGVSVKGAVQSVGDTLKGLVGGGTPPRRSPAH